MAYDPKAADNIRQIYPEEHERIVYASSAYEAVEKANALLVLTEWDEFSNLDLGRVKQAMANPIIVDGRNVLDPEAAKSQGFEYYSIGRK